MKIEKFNRLDCVEARGVAIVIDVIRAFTTAAYAFAAGADKIVTVGKIDEAFHYRAKNPNYLLMGEIKGEPIPGFQFGNSPSQFDGHQIKGETLVQRTTSGTQGVVAAVNADVILPASFVVANATLKRILALDPEQVSFIITGQNDGSEDLALADYLEACLLGRSPDPASYLERVKNSPNARKVDEDPNNACCSAQDLAEVLKIDRYAFALEVQREEEGLVMRPVHAEGHRWSL
ncbi:MAG: 2-phosphosulfolactate phosphatase [Chlamydiales bacterium]|nr:2-phosphosulfolactate phosphatase [Chlamydiales bacterium]